MDTFTFEGVDAVFAGSMCFCIILMTITIYMMGVLKIHWVPESIVTILLGAGIGITVKLIEKLTGYDNSMLSRFDSHIFFLFLLPPIIFESGYSLNAPHFFRNIFTICMYAFVGTIISAVITGLGLWALGLTGLIYKATLLDNMTYGSLIAAVDPVATLAIFNALDTSPMLYMTVFGESVLNDAVSVVLFRTLNSMSPESSATAILLLPLQFVWITVASVFVGVFTGLSTALLFRQLSLRQHRTLEIVLLLSASYLSYFIAEAMHLSGIMTILAVGFIARHYTSHSLSPESNAAMTEITHTISFVSEAAVFAYLGASIFAFSHTVEVGYIIATLVLILIGRACNIVPLTLLANRFRMYRVPRAFAFVQWFSGLRGAVAFALALTMVGGPAAVFITTTLAVVLFTVVVFGGSTLPLMKLLRIDSIKVRPHKVLGQDAVRHFMSVRVEQLLIEMGMFSEQTHDDVVTHFSRKSRVEKWDETYVQPIFRKSCDGEPLTKVVHDIKLRIAASFRRTDVPDHIKAKDLSRFDAKVHHAVTQRLDMVARVEAGEGTPRGARAVPRISIPTPSTAPRAGQETARHTPMLARRSMHATCLSTLPVGMTVHTSTKKHHKHRPPLPPAAPTGRPSGLTRSVWTDGQHETAVDNGTPDDSDSSSDGGRGVTTVVGVGLVSKFDEGLADNSDDDSESLTLTKEIKPKSLLTTTFTTPAMSDDESERDYGTGTDHENMTSSDSSVDSALASRRVSFVGKRS